MKRTRLALLFLLLLANGTRAQSTAASAIDQLCSDLETQLAIRFDFWKYSTSMAADAWKVDFNDVEWKMLQIQDSIYPDSAWLRKTIYIPDRILGIPVQGGVMKLQVTVDDAGFCWINGESKGLFRWTGEFVLTKNPRPGQAFQVAIKAINTGGPLRLLEARLKWDKVQPLADKVEEYILSLQVGQKLLSDDTYLKTGKVQLDLRVDHSTVPPDRRQKLRRKLEEATQLLEASALKNGFPKVFEASLEKSRRALKPIDDFAKEFTLVFDANAHIDCAWLWRYLETIEVAKNTFTSVLDMMEARPDFTYTQSQAHLYWWMETRYPEVFRRIQQRVRDARWEPIGGMWVEPDCNLISGESWARQLLYGKRYFKEKLGAEIKIGWNPDSFGYNWNMPQFYREAGIDAFITQKIGWNDTNMFPYRLFWWQSPDSTRLLTYFPNDYVNEIKNPFALVDWLRQFEANTGFKKMLVLYGVGDHGGGPSLEMINRIEDLKKLAIYPKVVYGTATEYLNWIRSQDLSTLPVWNDELYLEYHRGTYTTQSNTKKQHRESEILLGNAEQLAALASLYGRPYEHQDFRESWRGVLFNQFHDILPGSSIYAVYKDAAELYQQSQELARYQQETSLEFLAGQINTKVSKGSLPVIIYNPLAWPRTDVVEVTLPDGSVMMNSVWDDQGREVPCQVVPVGRHTRKMLFLAREIPAMGYAVYELRKQKPRATQTGLWATGDMLENEFLAVQLDAATGWVKRVVDKKLDRELLSGAGNELQLFKDVPSAWDAWEIALGERYRPTFRGIELVEDGPVRATIRVHHDFLKPGVEKSYPTPNNPNSYFTQEIMVYAGIDRIDFVTEADWWEEHVAMKVAFPVTAADTVATYEIPFGTITRPTTMRNNWQKARHEVNQHKWFDLTDNSRQFGVSLLNRAKYGGDIHGQVLRLTLLRSPKWPDPMADMGKHRMEYALYSHEQSWREGHVMQKGYEYNYPLLARVVDSHKGKWPRRQSFLSIAPAQVILHTVKKAEPAMSFADSSSGAEKCWVLRLFEAYGREADVRISLPTAPKRAVVSNFLEEDGAALPIAGKQVQMKLPAYRIATIKVWF
jgi:alpha-mannosidase